MITMALGGLWHGAAWTFVVWGVLHGALSLHQPCLESFRAVRLRRVSRARRNLAAFVLTFLSVVVAWVFFRANTISRRFYILSRMADPTHVAFGRAEMVQGAFVACYAALAWLAPNTQTIMGYDHKATNRRRRSWRLAGAPGVSLRFRCRAGARDSRHPAVQRIHLFQVLMSAPAQNRSSGCCARARSSSAAPPRSISSSIRCNCCGRAFLFRRCIPPTRRMQDAGLIRSQQFDTVFMGTSLAIHFRQSDIDRLLGGQVAEACR